ncbi:MAG: GNAT family protein [Chloroflexi bacterium]|nr:GNAT family protein [Chloroflexota bacterium]MDA1270058.1 GNAT family protein [Chloroflexota bacterium]PKB58754.1 MAG: hypothetical protein BZY83_05410 [SAR202 cluster bacterium Casp-Chloro-G2]
MFPEVTLVPPTREDVHRLSGWLKDSDVSDVWFGVGKNGKPLHATYNPDDVLAGGPEDWNQVFNDDNKSIFSVYDGHGQHIGEGQLLIEWPLLEAQAHLLIGCKDMWHNHYGTSALIGLLDHAFGPLGLHRVWVAVPEYNEPGMTMVKHLGFVLEGRLRKTHPKNDEWYDSSILGLLAEEYPRRRARLTETTVG